MSELFFVGSFTSGSSGTGIYSCVLEPATGAMSLLHTAREASDPAYLALSPNRQRLYAVQETPGQPAAHAFAVEEGGRLQHLGSRAVPGAGPCHLEPDPSGAVLAVANYGSGSVVLFGLEPNASLGEVLDSVRHLGSGPNPDRQEGPHAHMTAFGPDGLLYVPDLGLDAVRRYRVAGGRLEPAGATSFAAGSGPRHLVFHPRGRYGFVLTELAPALTLCRLSADGLEPLHTLPTVPEGAGPEDSGAAVRIHPAGRYVYASTRGHDSLSVFGFDPTAERLELLQVVSAGGAGPRDFNLSADGRLLLAASQQGDHLTSFWVDPTTGRLTTTGHSVSLGAPVCVVMA